MVKANQPSLLEAVTNALAGTDADFAGTSWTEEGNGHGRREKRGIRTAPAAGIGWPHAAQVMRIRRDTGPTRGPWTHKEIAYGITSLPADLAGPRHLAVCARQHWAIENREHYVRDKTFGEDLQRVRTSPMPAPPSAISSSAPSATPGMPTSPTPAATTPATTSASLPSTATPEQASRTSGHTRHTRRAAQPWPAVEPQCEDGLGGQ